jgi:hypothetical protein
VLIYLVVSTAAIAFSGTSVLVENPEDVLSVLGTEVFGSPLDKILSIAVLNTRYLPKCANQDC